MEMRRKEKDKTEVRTGEQHRIAWRSEKKKKATKIIDTGNPKCRCPGSTLQICLQIIFNGENTRVMEKQVISRASHHMNCYRVHAKR